jgi:hypothetical protein
MNMKEQDFSPGVHRLVVETLDLMGWTGDAEKLTRLAMELHGQDRFPWSGGRVNSSRWFNWMREQTGGGKAA